MAVETIVTKELLFAYFSGTVTSLQKQAIENWMATPQNTEQFYFWLDAWEKENLQYHADVDKAITAFRQFPANKNRAFSTVKIPEKKVSYILIRRLFAAASVVLLLAATTFFFSNKILYKTYTTGFGKIDSIRLDDGSKVVLNANSSLQVPRFSFNKDVRKVILHGEANFSVVHTRDNKKFVVETDSLFRVEVLGTEFSVSARTRQTKVVLLSGKVKVQYGAVNQALKTVTMMPGEVVNVQEKINTIQLKKVAKPENLVAWKQHHFVFDNTSLDEIKAILEDNYGLTVEMNSSLAAQTVSGSFKAENVDEFLRSISEVLNLTVNRQNNQVLLLKGN